MTWAVLFPALGRAETRAGRIAEARLHAAALSSLPAPPALAVSVLPAAVTPAAPITAAASPPTDAELAAAYRQARPESRAVEDFGIDFAAASAQALKEYTFMGSFFLEGVNLQGAGLAETVVGMHDAHDDAPARNFMQLLGRWRAFQDRAQTGRLVAPNLPPSPIANGEYWDMAAGMNAQGLIHRELDSNTRYSFFDASPFVASYLKAAAELSSAKNVMVVEGDVNRISKPARPLAVLRTKNAVYSVPGFDKKLEEMADWVAPGGQIVIQNDSNPAQRGIILKKHGPLIRRLLAEGWALDYGFPGRSGKLSNYALDTLILTRPKLARKKAPAETARAWKVYVDEVQRVDEAQRAGAERDPFAFLNL